MCKQRTVDLTADIASESSEGMLLVVVLELGVMGGIVRVVVSTREQLEGHGETPQATLAAYIT